MKLAFLCNMRGREQRLAQSLQLGMSHHKDTLEIVRYDDEPHELDCDMIGFVGLKCREWHHWCVEIGKPFLYFDNGYYYPKEESYSSSKGITKVWRVAANTNQPLEYLAKAKHSMRRWDGFGVRPKPWRQKGNHIIIAGSSTKFHAFHDLPHPTIWAREVVKELRQYTDRPIHYRPKPSWFLRSRAEAVPIAGAEFIPHGIFEPHAKGAHAIITYASNASLIGMIMGVPSIILGNGVMRLIASTKLEDIEQPYLATDEERLQLLANLAHTQYTLRELAGREAWPNIKKMLEQ